MSLAAWVVDGQAPTALYAPEVVSRTCLLGRCTFAGVWRSSPSHSVRQRACLRCPSALLRWCSMSSMARRHVSSSRYPCLATGDGHALQRSGDDRLRAMSASWCLAVPSHHVTSGCQTYLIFDWAAMRRRCDWAMVLMWYDWVCGGSGGPANSNKIHPLPLDDGDLKSESKHASSTGGRSMMSGWDTKMDLGHVEEAKPILAPSHRHNEPEAD